MGARLYDTERVVEELLTTYPDTRDNDPLLYLMVCKLHSPHIAKLPLERVLLERKELGIPSYTSVGRARRKLQSEREELRATSEVIDGRYENWKEFREYALS